jgi:hypothetical protein
MNSFPAKDDAGRDDIWIVSTPMDTFRVAKRHIYVPFMGFLTFFISYYWVMGVMYAYTIQQYVYLVARRRRCLKSPAN